MPTAFLFALMIAGVAAIADRRCGEISNWITLPPLVAAPIGYCSVLGASGAVLSMVSALVCAAVPYAVFRSGGMGGGDVKLFAALGATTGIDISTGVEIQLVSLVIAAVGAVSVLLRRYFRRGGGKFTRSRSRASTGSIDVRLGLPVLIGTALVLFGRIAQGRSVL